jgi:hypothetical protein
MQCGWPRPGGSQSKGRQCVMSVVQSEAACFLRVAARMRAIAPSARPPAGPAACSPVSHALSLRQSGAVCVHMQTSLVAIVCVCCAGKALFREIRSSERKERNHLQGRLAWKALCSPSASSSLCACAVGVDGDMGGGAVGSRVTLRGRLKEMHIIFFLGATFRTSCTTASCQVWEYEVRMCMMDFFINEKEHSHDR